MLIIWYGVSWWDDPGVRARHVQDQEVRSADRFCKVSMRNDIDPWMGMEGFSQGGLPILVDVRGDDPCIGMAFGELPGLRASAGAVVDDEAGGEIARPGVRIGIAGILHPDIGVFGEKRAQFPRRTTPEVESLHLMRGGWCVLEGLVVVGCEGDRGDDQVVEALLFLRSALSGWPSKIQCDGALLREHSRAR